VASVFGVGCGLGINSQHRWWRTHLSDKARLFLAHLWPWIFAVSVANGVLLVVGSIVLVYFFDLNMPDLFVYSFLCSILLILLDIFTGITRDIQISE
jgi:hypothetical protein